MQHSQCRVRPRSLSFRLSALAGTAALAAGISAMPARANDGMFPAAPAAKASIDFDGKGFLVKGKRTFIVSAGLEYARIPHELWRDRLLKIKRAGFNCVEIYVFWNFHEPQEGKWNFEGDHDLNAFLKLVNQMGLYATVRVGPYVCAEWDSGGYPVWLRFKPGVRVREDNPEFEGYVDKYFEKVMPIVAANQISRGGSVVMVQLENEHPQGWGTEEPNGYFRHLREKAVALGLEVPYFYSGLHHASDPAGNRPWDSAGRANPWYSTEFWCDWYDIYGNPTPKATTFEDRATWKIIAYGGNGYNYYMFHGGTNFDHWNNNEDASSYDYGSAIGQAGDIRPIYYKFKRAAMFTTTFADVLENSTNATAPYAGVATNTAIKVTARTSPAGTIAFLDNPTSTPVETQVKFPDAPGELLPKGPLPFRLEPGEIAPVVRDIPITPAITLERGVARIAAIIPEGDLSATVVVYGQPGTQGYLRFQGRAHSISEISPSFGPGSNVVTLRGTLGNAKLRVICLTDEAMDHTYVVRDTDGKQYVVCGTPSLGEFHVQDGVVHLTKAFPIADVGFDKGDDRGDAESILVYGPNDSLLKCSYSTSPTAAVPVPTLSAWQTKSAADEAKPDFDAKSWKSSDAPLPMGADGDDGAYAWYRTTVHAPKAGQYQLGAATIRDRALIWVDGTRVPSASLHGNSITLDLTAGDHAVAVFAIHNGRDKLFGHLGPIDTIDAKGLTGPSALRQTAPGGATLTGWRYQMAERGHRDAPPAASDAAWQPATIGADVFNRQRGFAWYATPLPALTTGTASTGVLHFDGVDDNATVFLNGKRIGAHRGWDEAFDIPLTAANLRTDGQPNTLAILVENTDNTGGLAAPVTLATYAYDAPVTAWKMRGGTTDPLASKGWTAYAPELSLSTGGSGPRVYRATFTAAPPAATGEYRVLRATFAGLSHGFMYLNGHNLGRYPEKVPIDGIYLPECYLKSGDNANTLTIFEEEGNAPTGVHIEEETTASRVVREVPQKPIKAK